MNMPAFEQDLEALLNKHSVENGSDTPDFILAAFLVGCLRAWNQGVSDREAWYSRQRPAGEGPNGWNPSEAVYAFAGYLSTRATPITCSETHSAAELCELVDAFRRRHALAPPRDGWDRHIRNMDPAPGAPTPNPQGS